MFKKKLYICECKQKNRKWNEVESLKENTLDMFLLYAFPMKKKSNKMKFCKVYPCLCKNNSFINFCAKVYRKLDEREKNVKHFILNKALASFIVTVLSCMVHVCFNLQLLPTSIFSKNSCILKVFHIKILD